MIKGLNSDILNSLSNSEIEVLKYIEKNKRKVLDMSVQELSKNTFISTATIIRLCKKIGLSGFAELKYKIREELKHEKIEVKELSSLEKVKDIYLYEIKQTSSLISEEDVDKVVDLLLENRNVHFFGKGLTSTALQYISKYLLTCNRLNICYEDTHIAYLAAEAMTEKDVLFVASLSGRTHQVLKMLQIAKSKGAKIIAITNIDNNEISEIADINFRVYVNEDSKFPYDMKSRIPVLFILHVIINRFVERRNLNILNIWHRFL